MLTYQVRFTDDNGVANGGILVDDCPEPYVICGCCGGIFPVNEIGREHIRKYGTWVNLSDEIVGDDDEPY